jgi:hypothetical protein
MKKKILLLSSLLMFITIAFIACKKDLSMNTVQQTESTNSTNSLARYSSEYTPVDFEAVNVGGIHNQLLEDAFEELLSTNEDYLDFVLNYFHNVEFDYEGLGMSKPEWEELLSTVNGNMIDMDFDLRNYNGEELNENTKSYIIQILDLCDDIVNLELFNESVDQIVEDASEEIFDIDFDIIKASALVAKSSAKLWAPTSIGGDGFYDRFIENGGSAHAKQLKWWQKALVGDVSGASQYFLTLGVSATVTAAAIPGTNALLGLGLGISVGLSSGFAALF